MDLEKVFEALKASFDEQDLNILMLIILSWKALILQQF